MKQLSIENITPNLAGYFVALTELEAVKANEIDFSSRLRKAKTDAERADIELKKATQKKKSAVSMDEIQSASREVEKYSRQKDDASSLVENLTKAMEKQPAAHTEAFNKLHNARSEAFKSYAAEITNKLAESTEFKAVVEVVQQAFVAQNIAFPGSSYRLFLESTFGELFIDQLPQLHEQTMAKFGVKV